MTHDDGATPFERLTSRLEDEDLACPDCGYESEDGEWESRTDGDRVLYRHACPSCGAVRERTVHLDDG